jgi:glycosyltransferase involved in cell wall biosynthesis
MLLKLLSKFEEQVTNNLFYYSVVIVDNDKYESARQTVESYAKHSNLQIRYFVEIEQNISLARNRALKNSEGDFIGLIDDDEYPPTAWLLNLYTSFNTYKPSGGVLGPVVPVYPEGTPQWLIKSKICDRPNPPTGTLLDWNMTRTGNVLISRGIFKENGFIFDSKKGRTGGEDKDFFKILIEHGYSFIWCREAPVYEVIYEDRWKLSHYLHRSLMMGGVEGKEHGIFSLYLIRSLISLLCYSVSLCVSIFRGRHNIYKNVIRVVYDYARVMGCLGFVFEKERRE